MSFVYERIIRMKDTDATGVLYFANQLQIGLEAFEEFMRQAGFSLTQMVQKEKFFLPIVHTKADFFHPATIGEKLDVTLEFPHIGTTSFIHSSEFRKGSELIGTASIVHVVYSPQKEEPEPIPESLKKYLLKGGCHD